MRRILILAVLLCGAAGAWALSGARATPIKWIDLDICSPEAGLRIHQFSSADYRVVLLSDPPHENVDKALTQPFGFDATELETTSNKAIVKWRGYEFRNCL